ncbi:hypothetical protein GCM10012319_31120 [Comamonas sp. KCTC 72670]|nr:hypothetical protein GCM10012319_31120 [Comamonas sp. KCTC 72670]
MNGMRQSLLLHAVLAFSLVGCVSSRFDVVKMASTEKFAVINIDGRNAYLIDPRTESCFLMTASFDNHSTVHVPCDKLKRNVPEAATFITWAPSGEEAPAVSAPTP